MTRYESYDVFGHAIRIVDPNGVAKEFTYDAMGRLTASTLKGVPGCDTSVDPLCATDLTATRSYDGAGPLHSEQLPSGGITVYAYDDRGRLETASRGPLVADLRERIETSYDALTGKKTLERTLAFEDEQWVEKRRESFSYDAEGRIETITHADNASIHYSYDAAGRIANTRDENHATPNAFHAYDAAGRTVSVTQTLSTAATGWAVTGYAYDPQGNLTSVTDPNGNVTTYIYDDFGQRLTQQSPVTGMTSYAYDAAGHIVSATDANGATTTRAYDALGRNTSATSSRTGVSTETVLWQYDDSTSGTFGIGRLSQMTDPAGVTHYAYQRQGQLRREERAFVGVVEPYVTTFRYDANGNRSTIGYPSGMSVSYTFDFANRPVTATAEATPLITATAYLPFGPMRSLTFANATIQSMAYDTRYRISRNALTTATATLAQYDYQYDAVGNITQIHDAVDAAYNRDFAYDDLNRLATANTGANLWLTGTYAYDPMGNMLSQHLGEIIRPPDPGDQLRFKPRTDVSTLPLGRVSLFEYDGTTPKLTKVTNNDLERPVAYDAVGNEISYVIQRTYSARNLLSSVIEPLENMDHTIKYAYDGRGLRVKRSEPPASGGDSNRYFVYSPELQLLSITNDDVANPWVRGPRVNSVSPSIKTEIVWFAGRPIAQVEPSVSLLFTFTDHLGTPIIQTAYGTPTIVWQAEYEPYGNIYEMRVGNRTGQPLRFPGQEVAMTLEGQEENYNIFRWYQSGWGRYTQADPIGSFRKSGMKLEANNLYAYVDANPVGSVDPLGLVKWNCGFIIGSANVPVGPGGGGFFASCRSECTNGKSVFVQLGSTLVGLSAGPLPGGLSAFSSQLDDRTETADANNLVGIVIYGSIGAWIPFGGGCGNVILGKAKGTFSCSRTWFGGIDIGADVYGGYSAIILGPYGKCCR